MAFFAGAGQSSSCDRVPRWDVRTDDMVAYYDEIKEAAGCDETSQSRGNHRGDRAQECA